MTTINDSPITNDSDTELEAFEQRVNEMLSTGELDSALSITDENGETVSAVDQDCTILRIIDLHDFGVRHEESFVIGKGLKTGA